MFTLFTKHTETLKVDIEEEVKQIAEKKEEIIIKKNKKRIPDENPQDYDIDYIIVSQNDNKKYVVTENKKGKKLWKRFYSEKPLSDNKKEILEI